MTPHITIPCPAPRTTITPLGRLATTLALLRHLMTPIATLTPFRHLTPIAPLRSLRRPTPFATLRSLRRPTPIAALGPLTAIATLAPTARLTTPAMLATRVAPPRPAPITRLIIPPLILTPPTTPHLLRLRSIRQQQRRLPVQQTR